MEFNTVLCHGWQPDSGVCEDRLVPITKVGMETDGAQNMLSQKMALRQAEYFKLKEFEKMAEERRSFWLSPLSGPCLLSETGHKNLMWEVSSLFQEEGRILLSEDKGMPRRILTSHTKCPSVYYTSFISLTFHTAPQFSTLHQTSIKTHKLNCFFGHHFFMSCKTSIKLICMLVFCDSVFVTLLLWPSQGP